MARTAAAAAAAAAATPCMWCARQLVRDAALRAWCAAPHTPGAGSDGIVVVFEHAGMCAQCTGVTCGARRCAQHVGGCISCAYDYCAACFVGSRGERGESAAAAVARLQRDARGIDTPDLRCWTCEAQRRGKNADIQYVNGMWMH